MSGVAKCKRCGEPLWSYNHVPALSPPYTHLFVSEECPDCPHGAHEPLKCPGMDHPRLGIGCRCNMVWATCETCGVSAETHPQPWPCIQKPAARDGVGE